MNSSWRRPCRHHNWNGGKPQKDLVNSNSQPANVAHHTKPRPSAFTTSGSPRLNASNKQPITQYDPFPLACHPSSSSARTTVEVLRNIDVKLTNWPSSNHDLNIIEHVWAILKKAELQSAIVEEWSKVITKELARNFKKFYRVVYCTLLLIMV